ncbi:MAG: TIGR02147 family protein [Fibrobacterota bacterium]
MDPVYNYLDYREYIKDCLLEKKEADAGFSYSEFSRNAGFKSCSFIHHVLEGKRSVSKDTIFKLAKACGLKGKAFGYFEDLVFYNQTADVEQKDYYYKKIASKRHYLRVSKVEETQYEFYSSWHHTALREMLFIVDFDGEDFAGLSKLFMPRIKAVDLRKSLQLLLKLGLVEKKDGFFKPIKTTLSPKKETKSLFIKKFQKETIGLAENALNDTEDKRDISTVSLGLSEKGFKNLKAYIKEFRKGVMKMAAEDSNENRVYQLNLQLFPMSKNIKEKR